MMQKIFLILAAGENFFQGKQIMKKAIPLLSVKRDSFFLLFMDSALFQGRPTRLPDVSAFLPETKFLLNLAVHCYALRHHLRNNSLM